MVISTLLARPSSKATYQAMDGVPATIVDDQ